jgi:hypothetical protein
MGVGCRLRKSFVSNDLNHPPGEKKCVFPAESAKTRHLGREASELALDFGLKLDLARIRGRQTYSLFAVTR